MNWECTQCGRCCKKWYINIDPEDAKNLQKCGYDVNKFLGSRNGRLFLRHRNSKCLFLTKDNKCRVQLEHGYKFKPNVCRQFPFDKNNANRFVCGNVLHVGYSRKPFINNNKAFEYKGKIIPMEILLYSIGKIQPENCYNSWYTMLKGIESSKNKVVEKDDIDEALKNPQKISKLQSLRLKMILSGYSSFVFPELMLLILRKSNISLKFACEKISLDLENIKSVEIKDSKKQDFIDSLKKGYGIIYKPNYPDHLLFCLFFLEDFSKQIAYRNKRKKVLLSDMLTAYSILNSTLLFS